MARTPTLPPDHPGMWRRLVARTHPDAGGDHELFIWTGADEQRAKLAEQVNREAEEVAALERELAAKRHALESKMALDRWLENPEGGFGVAPQGVAA